MYVYLQSHAEIVLSYQGNTLMPGLQGLAHLEVFSLVPALPTVEIGCEGLFPLQDSWLVLIVVSVCMKI